MAQQTAVSKMETTQAAVDWFFLWFIDNPQATHKEYLEAFDKAKAMEKELALRFGIKCQIDFIKSDGIRTVEDIYNETYNK